MEHGNKGLDVAYHFYLEWALPYIQKDFPELTGKIAAGRIFGSDVLGGDDEISRDHNWGPQIHLFLSDEDYHRIGDKLSQCLNREAPNPWKGYRLAGAGDRSVQVEDIPVWFRTHFGINSPVPDINQWKGIVESNLYFLKHGALWCDELGIFSKWRESLAHYPREILYSRIAEECFRVWHYGEYNFVQRISKRRDPLTTSVCLSQFVEGVMRIQFLLNGDFTPYWKWLSHEFRKAAFSQIYLPALEDLLQVSDVERQIELVKEICHRVHMDLINKEIISGKNDNPYLLPLLNAYNEIKGKSIETL